ncbi:MAG: sigma-70 family RNA polymerase sigma factor [Pirellulaceae bacterium]|nr:sigma-70 family RNA polymerase sigma factor [Pirellulaceae bacterium]
MDSSGDALAQRLIAGDKDALADAFSEYRDRLWRMVRFRLDSRLMNRVDPDDILQESFMAAATRLDHFAKQNGEVSAFVWLRQIVAQTMIDVHRRHIGAQMRDANRDVSMHGQAYPQATSISLAAQLVGRMTSPSHVAMREELSTELEEAIQSMEPIDQEVLALRHFEELSNREVAEVLGIQQKAASIRYIRAIARLKDVLQKIPGFFDDHGDQIDPS